MLQVGSESTMIKTIQDSFLNKEHANENSLEDAFKKEYEYFEDNNKKEIIKGNNQILSIYKYFNLIILFK